MAKDARTIQTGVLYRSLPIKRDAVNEEKRTVELSFSSETPVERYFGTEILDHSPTSVDLSRLNSGGAVLVDHNTRDQVGVVENARVDSDKVGRATVRFGKSARANEIFQDVKDGIRSLVSVGYRINKMVTESDADEGEETLRATSWTPLEISLVSIPADASVGVGREEEKTFKTIIEKEMKNILRDHAPADGGDNKPAKPAPSVNVEEVRAEANKIERLRVKEIRAIADKIKTRCPDVEGMASQAIDNGDTVEAFRTAAFEKITNAKPLNTPNLEVLSDQRDYKKYSLSRAILAAANGERSGFEFEVSQEIAKQRRQDPQGFFVPQEVFASTRALNVSTATAGGFLVGTELKAGELIELLRNRPVVAQMGARVLTGLVGNVTIPKISGAATAYWVSENGSATESDQSFGQLALTPHRLVMDTAISKELLVQNAVASEAIVREDLDRVRILALDLAALQGTGKAGQPLGILNTPGIGSVSFSAAATWAKILAFETTLSQANADLGSIGWITSPGVRGKWKGATKISSSQYSSFLWDNDNTVNGYKAVVTNQIANTGTFANRVIFGNWNDLLLASWAGIDVVVDPYSLKKQGQIEITVTEWADVGVRHEVSFVASSDSGAQ